MRPRNSMKSRVRLISSFAALCALLISDPFDSASPLLYIAPAGLARIDAPQLARGAMRSSFLSTEELATRRRAPRWSPDRATATQAVRDRSRAFLPGRAPSVL